MNPNWTRNRLAACDLHGGYPLRIRGDSSDSSAGGAPGVRNLAIGTMNSSATDRTGGTNKTVRFELAKPMNRLMRH